MRPAEFAYILCIQVSLMYGIYFFLNDCISKIHWADKDSINLPKVSFC